MLNRTWKEHGAIFTIPNKYLEDFTVVKEGKGYAAYYTRGGSLQDQRLFRQISPAPLGPWSNEEQLTDYSHTRLYRGRLDAKRIVVTAVWPGLPKAGLWLFTQAKYGDIKELLVPPVDGTLYSQAVANPGVYWDGTHWNVYFEGRNETVFWRLFQAVLDKDARVVRVIPDPVCEGANPSLLRVDDTVYMFYSKWNERGFDTHVLSIPANAVTN